MYSGLLHTHNALRWLVVGLLVLTVLYALVGWLAKRDFERVSRALGLTTLIVFNLQVVIGFVLYILSPLVTSAFGDFEAAMKTRELRFFALEHPIAMIVATVFVHLGAIRAPRGATDQIRHRRALVWFGLTLVATLAMIPWWRAMMPGG